MGPVEFAIFERQVAAVRLHEPHPRIDGLQEAGVVDPHRGHPMFMRVPGLQVVGVVIAAIRGGADVDDGLRLADSRGLHETFEHPPALIAGDAHRQGVRLGDVVLGVDVEGLGLAHRPPV